LQNLYQTITMAVGKTSGHFFWLNKIDPERN